MIHPKNQALAAYSFIQILFEKLETRDQRIAVLEAENAELIRKLAEKLFKKESGDE